MPSLLRLRRLLAAFLHGLARIIDPPRDDFPARLWAADQRRRALKATEMDPSGRTRTDATP